MLLSFIFVGEQVLEEGPIDEIKTPDMIRQEPYKLPNGFKWVDIDLYNEADVFWSLSHSNSHLGQGCVRSFVGELRRGYRLPLPLRLLCRLPQVVCFVEDSESAGLCVLLVTRRSTTSVSASRRPTS